MAKPKELTKDEWLELYRAVGSSTDAAKREYEPIKVEENIILGSE